ncbi:MAG: SigB/SigF/SigG family RNA polymerase sigma factor [Solirubrobacterales bacterium]
MAQGVKAKRAKTEADLWDRRLRTRDPIAREELVRLYLPLARGIALGFTRGGESFDDLLQVASIGLLQAIDRFDPSRGRPFVAYATPTIRCEIKRYFRDRSWTIRVPRGIHDRILEIDRCVDRLTRGLQRSPTVGEIAADLEIETTDVLEAMEAVENRRTLSIDRPPRIDSDEEADNAEWLGAEDDGYGLVEDRMALADALPDLEERELLILRLRFAAEMTQAEIAEQIGCSQMHVSRILRRVLARIREAADAEVG